MEESACSNPDVLVPNGNEVSFRLVAPSTGEELIDAIAHERHGLSVVAQDDLEARKVVEELRGEQAEKVHRDLGVPTQGRAGDQSLRDVIVVSRVAVEVVRRHRVDVDGDVELLGLCEQGAVLRTVVELAICVVPDQRAHEAEILDAPLQLAGTGLRVAHGQEGEASQAAVALLHGREELVVDRVTHIRRHHRRDVAHHLDLHVAPVHVLDASIAQVGEVVLQCFREHVKIQRRDVLHRRRGEMLFDADQYWCHGCRRAWGGNYVNMLRVFFQLPRDEFAIKDQLGICHIYKPRTWSRWSFRIESRPSSGAPIVPRNVEWEREREGGRTGAPRGGGVCGPKPNPGHVASPVGIDPRMPESGALLWVRVWQCC